MLIYPVNHISISVFCLHFNPALLSELARQSTPVVTLSEIPRSLEEVYLQIVESDQKLEDALKETGEKPFE